ncbi:MAG: uracil-DNA glycosylase [Myxococcota bacterium]
MQEKIPNLEPGWLNVLGDEFSKLHMVSLRSFLVEERKRYTLFPPMKDVFNAFWLTPFDQARVVILGQDPYHGRGQAHGLCFSVQRGVKPPPSLLNIYQELRDDLGVPPAHHGELTAWARQGVLLLNTVLTVREGEAGAHAGKGWEPFTDRVIYELNTRKEGLVFLLWGKPAQAKAAMVDMRRHKVIRSAHPSPYSANAGFFGSRPFSQTNTWLEGRGEAPIQWQLPP